MTGEPSDDNVPDSWRNWWNKPVWAAVTALATVVLAVVGVYGVWPNSRGDVGDASSPVASYAPTSPVTTADCLVYSGQDSEPHARVVYAENDFSRVDCVLPHQYEIVSRDADTTCEQAVRALTGIGSMPGFQRIKTTEYGPYSCALGRMVGDTLQTDTYRISTNKSALSAFGSCIEPDDVEIFLSGSLEYRRNVPCHTGKVLPASWTIAGDLSPQESCEQSADDIWAHEVRSAPYVMEVQGASRPAVRCAYTLVGISSS